MNNKDILSYLIRRGDAVAIENGRLKILPVSGVQVPEEWLAKNSHELSCEILRACGQDAWKYVGYSTGQYKVNSKTCRAGGVTLQFTNILTNDPAYVIFNAELNRARGDKKGTPLPKGHFRVGRQSNFFKFWASTELKIPPRISSFYDYMGNLRGIIFVGEIHKDRIKTDSLKPLELTCEQVSIAIRPDRLRTNYKQMPDIIRTSIPDKDCAQPHAEWGLQDKSTKCQHNHGIGNQGDACIRGNVYPLHVGKTMEEQTNTEWLDDYGLD